MIIDLPLLLLDKKVQKEAQWAKIWKKVQLMGSAMFFQKTLFLAFWGNHATIRNHIMYLLYCFSNFSLLCCGGGGLSWRRGYQGPLRGILVCNVGASFNRLCYLLKNTTLVERNVSCCIFVCSHGIHINNNNYVNLNSHTLHFI